MFVCIIYTALFTPYELAFVLRGQKCDVASFYFLCNRIIDGFFLIDLCFSFISAIKIKTNLGERLLTKKREITKNYLSSWFVWDLLASIPWDYLDCSAVDGVTQLKIFRLVRLLRLTRLRKLERILNRAKDRVGLDYASRTLVRFVVWTLLLSHWMACIWGYVGIESGRPKNCFVESGMVVDEPGSLDYSIAPNW